MESFGAAASPQIFKGVIVFEKLEPPWKKSLIRPWRKTRDIYANSNSFANPNPNSNPNLNPCSSSEFLSLCGPCSVYDVSPLSFLLCLFHCSPCFSVDLNCFSPVGLHDNSMKLQEQHRQKPLHMSMQQRV